MDAILLAAGRGSRMRGLTELRPKCLVELDGETLLDRQCRVLREAGIERIGIVTGYRRDLLQGRGLVEFHNPRWERTNMVASLACAEAWLSQAPCIVSYSDIFYPAEPVRALTACEADLALTYDVDWLALWRRRFADPLLDAETFRADASGRLRVIGGKPASLDEVQGQYMGLLRISPRGWREIERLRARMDAGTRDAMHMTGTLQAVIEAGAMAITAIPFRGPWGEVDSPEDLQAYRP